MRRVLFGFAALGAVACSGCAYVTATPAVQGRAYVVRNSYTGSTLWNCDASGGQPVCYQTQQQSLPPGTNK